MIKSAHGSNEMTAAAIACHLQRCDAQFVPALSSRVDIVVYAKKLAQHARLYTEWQDTNLTGLVAAYGKPGERDAYISNVSVLRENSRQGVAKRLLASCIADLTAIGAKRILLEVGRHNYTAIRLYQQHGFTVCHSLTDAAGTADMALSTGQIDSLDTIKLQLLLSSRETMPTGRNYDTEIRDTKDHDYAYRFDFEVMHPYMIASFSPFFRPGNVLELGSFKGDFTQRLLDCFSDVTCVEASEVAILEARKKLCGKSVQLIHAPFETAQLPRRYDNIVLTHVLEHLDDPVAVLKRICTEWLSDEGRLFVACPNANAPSRQIAVKMGLISHNSAVTQAEAEHGHRRTYTLDTLEHDAVAAGLRVVQRSGIFFKALANFQWDRLLQTDIISTAYLDGCYSLGQQYPDLCSTIFLVCEAKREK